MIPAPRCTYRAFLFGGLVLSTLAYTPSVKPRGEESSLEHGQHGLTVQGRLLRKQGNLLLEKLPLHHVAVAVDGHGAVSRPINLGSPESLAMSLGEEDTGDGDGDGGEEEAPAEEAPAEEAPAEEAAEEAPAEAEAEAPAGAADAAAAEAPAEGETAEAAPAEGAPAEAAPAEAAPAEAATEEAATTVAATVAPAEAAATTAVATAAAAAAATTAVPTTVALATGAGKAHKVKAVSPDANGKHDGGSKQHAKVKGKSKGKTKSSTSGRSGSLPWKPILLVVLLVALVAIAGPKLYEMATAKPQLPGRLNEIKSDPADQEVWAKSKARQTYRKSVLAAQSNKSSSDSEDGKPATRASGSNEATPS